jgi:hemolysin activation/secretion protein
MSKRAEQVRKITQKNAHWKTAASCAVLAISHLAHAQVGISAQQDADQQRCATERQNQLREQQDRTPDVRLPTPNSGPTSTLSEPQSPCFTIHELQLQQQGSTSGRFDWLLGQLDGPAGLDSPLNKCLGSKGIRLVLHRAQEALVARGYVTSRVLAQPQDLSTGKLVLSVLPGTIREVHFAPPVDPRATAWNAVPFKPGDILNLRDIEQALENFKRVPTAEADIQIVPAQGAEAQL